MGSKGLSPTPCCSFVSPSVPQRRSLAQVQAPRGSAKGGHCPPSEDLWPPASRYWRRLMLRRRRHFLPSWSSWGLATCFLSKASTVYVCVWGGVESWGRAGQALPVSVGEDSPGYSAKVQILVWPLVSCVTMGKRPNL